MSEKTRSTPESSLGIDRTEAVLNSVEEAISAMAAGELIIVVDDADRENEGDLIMAAELATADQVAFMIRHTSGILCVPVTLHDARRLQLTPMVSGQQRTLADGVYRVSGLPDRGYDRDLGRGKNQHHTRDRQQQRP